MDVDIGSSADVGSSIRITSGFTASALAMQSLCCCPPERPSADFLSLSLSSSHIAASLNDFSTISSSFDFDLMPCVLGPNAILSYTLIGNGFGFWNTMPTLFLSAHTSIFPKISSPSRRTFPVILQPATKSFILLSVFMNVDLPQPDGPINAVISFSLILRLISLSAWKFP